MIPPGPEAPADLGQLEVLDHPADVRLRLAAASAGALYRTGVAGLAAVLRDEANAPLSEPAPDDVVQVSLVGSDPGDLLACLFNEALFLLEDTGALPVSFRPARVTDTELAGELGLKVLTPERTDSLLTVKAATYGELRWETDAAGAVTAEITLDL